MGTHFSRWIAGITLVASAVAPVAMARDLSLATGRQGGSQYPITVALAQVIEGLSDVDSVTLKPGGGTSNVAAVGLGQADLAITLSPSAVDGMAGVKPYPAPMADITQLFALHGFKITTLVAADSNIKSFRDLAGKKVSIGPNGWTINTMAKKILEMEGMSVRMETLKPDDAVQQLKDGNIDAIINTPSDLYAPFLDLATAREVRLVPLTAGIQKQLIDENASFYLSTWPADTSAYPKLVNTVETVSYPNIIIANGKTVSDDLAYRIVKQVVESFEKVADSEPSLKVLKLSDLAVSVGVPFHPGAARYFKERGWM
ncbi:MAG: TAXI family TRAP transporter solute-binding subunit [Gammaproteobacteria bacterium]|nr:TAXI family TRAP transporter solute-binding subunit [Gammaproteobacteria bacterium]